MENTSNVEKIPKKEGAIARADVAEPKLSTWHDLIVRRLAGQAGPHRVYAIYIWSESSDRHQQKSKLTRSQTETTHKKIEANKLNGPRIATLLNYTIEKPGVKRPSSTPKAERS